MSKIGSLRTTMSSQDKVGPPPPIAPTPVPPRPQASVKKVAAILDFSERHVRDLCARGELEWTGKGRGFRIFLDSVTAYQERERLKARKAS